ncbi:MAG: hypothetical protein J6L86_05900 [Alphaproteobacteria bacterium]|nr:hypothetical protein [Alphaproteobacteria bacterium]
MINTLLLSPMSAKQTLQLTRFIHQGIRGEKKLQRICCYALEQVFAMHPLNKKWLDILFSVSERSFVLKILGKYNHQIRQANLQTACYRYLKKINQDYLALLFL